MDYFSNFSENFLSQTGTNLPNAIIAILIILIGWFIAGFVKRICTRLLSKTSVDNLLKGSNMSIAKLVGKFLYFMIMIIVFMVALERLGMTNALEPLRNMVNKFLNTIPNVVASGVIAYVGYMLAKIVSELVELSGETIQKFAPKLRLPENIDLVSILKKVVFILIFIPILISAFEVLNMRAISAPASEMLASFFNAIPKVLLASVILILFVFVGRFVSELLRDLLESLKIDSVLEKANIQFAKTTNMATVISNIAYAFIIVFGLLTAVEKLEFTRLTQILDTVVSHAGNILFGLVILLIGSWIAKLATDSFKKSDNNQFVASIIKIAIIAIFLAIGLRTMGIADDIINLAFGITLGTVALTIVLSFGLGGREAAGKQMHKILEKFNRN